MKACFVKNYVAVKRNDNKPKCFSAPRSIYCARSEITIVVLLPSIVTFTCIGNAPSGTAEATKVLVLGSNFNQPGNGLSVTVVTLITALLPVAVLAT